MIFWFGISIFLFGMFFGSAIVSSYYQGKAKTGFVDIGNKLYQLTEIECDKAKAEKV
ncbi:hypothetical protein SAMN05421784_14916 [Xenorhabdus koppenhoeferi]|uniref:Uncharacterized protein n=1 Tax=Xenorhabdus koppenhoeferi TaxID=351659 RepID=A0A1I7K8E4_9GAMM|nr:hypothetical protein SAMN05421784_14916 [Xenorhabdus koppenhoeferi]